MDQEVYFKNKKDSVWRAKYKSPEEFYLMGGEFDDEKGRYDYDPQYYSFDKYQLEIDPDEPHENYEKYSQARRKIEIQKCCESFSYFCHKYVKILHPTKGLIPFVLYKYQVKVINDYENHRFNIISKFRQGGLTTVSLLWGLWRCMFREDQQILVMSRTDHGATDIGQMVDRSCEHFPSWLQPLKDGKWNDHHKEFPETGSALKFHSPEAARGKAVTFLIIDEAAFIENMDKHWKAMYPVLSGGGGCTLVSTVNGVGNWYEQTYHEAREKINKFNIIDLDYWEHPDYNDPKWVEDQRAQLAERGFNQEILREFLGSGETYFSQKVIVQLTEQTRHNYPNRKLYPKWINKVGRIAQIENDHPSQGAFWMWKEPIDGHEYIVGVDCAEGQGENNDNSCFQIIDTSTLEQVAEFYSNTIVPNEFSQVLYEVGCYYNKALMCVENMGPGGAVISHLQHQLFYENMYFENLKSSNNRPGIKVNNTNRPQFLEMLQNRLLNQTIRINSIRFVMELNTFEFNPNTKKAQAQKGKHDDAIMAMCMALFVRDSMMRDIPIGAEVPKDISSALKNAVYEEIKNELMAGKPQDLLAFEPADLLSYDHETSAYYNLQRKNNRLYSEFGW